MDSSSSSNNRTRPCRAKQTLLLNWFRRSQKETTSELISEAAGETDREVLSLESNLTLCDDSSVEDLGCQEPAGPNALETPLAKKTRVDDFIEITDSLPSLVDCDIAQDEPESCCISDSENEAANCAISQYDIVPSTEASTVQSTYMNFTSDSIVAGTESTQQTQTRNDATYTTAMSSPSGGFQRNPPEDIAAVATSLPIQPINIKYPVTLYSNKPRSFNPEWFKLYPWLEYSVKQDACFCFPCRMFGSSGGVSSSRPEKAFTVLGFKDWKHATGKDGILKGHDNSHTHKQAVIAWKEFEKMDSSIIDKLGGTRQEQVKKNRHYLKTLCEIILLCSNQEIALRGHRENEASENKGNFIEILNLVARHDNIVSSRLAHLPKNAVYTSPKIQNDLLSIMAGMVRKEISLAIQNAGLFSILADETKDVSKQEQLVIVLRYVDKSTCTVHERFLTFVVAKSLNAEGLSDYIVKTLKEYNLDPALIVSQGYDGASVMSRSCSGVQQRIKMIAPNATYVHCYAHCLNLALVDCVRNVQDTSEFFALMELLYVFMSSSKAQALYLKKQVELHPAKQTRQLQRLSDTRWACRYFAIDAVCCTYDSIIATLEDVSKSNDGSKAVEAKGILYQVKSFKFILLLVIFSRILSFTKSLSDQLQSVTNDMARAADLVVATIETVEELRSNSSWDHLYKYTQDVAKLNMFLCHLQLQ